MPDNENTKAMQGRIRELAQRAKNDPRFKEQLSADPVATLRQVGLEDAAIREILADDGVTESDPRVQGKFGDVSAMRWCVLTDCPCTRCCITSF